MVAGMTGPTREEVERLAAAFRRATFSKGRTVGGICGQTIDAMMANTMHEVSALYLEEGACALETLAAENAALRARLEAAEADRKQGERDYCDLMERHDAHFVQWQTQRRRVEAMTAQLTEARAREAAAWEAAASLVEMCDHSEGEEETEFDKGYDQACDENAAMIRAAAPTDAAEALAARLDAARDEGWNAALENIAARLVRAAALLRIAPDGPDVCRERVDQLAGLFEAMAAACRSERRTAKEDA